MKTDREKLIELIHHCTSCEECHDSDIADHLIANGVTVREWISVEERLPELDEDVLCFYRGWRGECGYTVGSVQSWNGMWGLEVDPDDYGLDEVTHWMPLPEAPKEG